MSSSSKNTGYHVIAETNIAEGVGGVAVLHKDTIRYQDELNIIALLAYVLSVYSPADPTHHRDVTDALWTEVDQWIQSRFKLPIMIAGDMNEELDGHNKISHWMANAGFHDPHLHWEGPRQATHKDSRVLDHILLSEALHRRCQQAHTWQDWPFPTHRPLEIVIGQPPLQLAAFETAFGESARSATTTTGGTPRTVCGLHQMRTTGLLPGGDHLLVDHIMYSKDFGDTFSVRFTTTHYFASTLARIQQNTSWTHGSTSPNCLDPSQMGARPGTSTAQALLQIRQTLDLAQQQDKEIYILQLDLVKAFNCMDHVIAAQILRHWGIDPPPLQQLVSHYYRHTTRIRYHGSRLGAEHACDRGLLQGDPISVVMAQAVLALPAAKLRQQMGDAVDQLWYMDDSTIVAYFMEDIETAGHILLQVFNALGIQINFSKSSFLHNGPPRPIDLDNKRSGR